MSNFNHIDWLNAVGDLMTELNGIGRTRDAANLGRIAVELDTDADQNGFVVLPSRRSRRGLVMRGSLSHLRNAGLFVKHNGDDNHPAFGQLVVANKVAA